MSWPALARLPEGERESLLREVMRRFAWIKWTGVAVVLVTGVIQYLFEGVVFFCEGAI